MRSCDEAGYEKAHTSESSVCLRILLRGQGRVRLPHSRRSGYALEALRRFRRLRLGLCRSAAEFPQNRSVDRHRGRPAFTAGGLREG